IRAVAERRSRWSPPNERPRARAEIVDGQPAVEIDIVEGLRQISGLAFVGIAVQQHDRGVAALAQEVQQMKRIRIVQVAVAVAEPDVKLQRLAEAQSLMDPE